MSTSKDLSTRVDDPSHGQQSGVILVFAALMLVVLLGMIGLAIDLGHAYVNKSQLQNIADACALAGASALDETSAGIVEAQSRATDTGSYLDNRFEFNKKPLTIDPNWVSYSTELQGTYVPMATAQGSPAGIKFVKVAIPSSQASAVFFAKVIPGVPGAINIGAVAVAGRASQTKVCSGLDPFCVAPIDKTDPTGNFGFVKGDVYGIRLSTNSKKAECISYYSSVVTGNFGFSIPFP